jgi:polyferredoxin
VRAWNVALIGMAVILATSWVLPRGFGGYLCPLGTLIDLFDLFLGKCRPAGKARSAHGWTNVRFHVLAAVLAAGLGGVLLSGFVAAIPVLTRGLVFSVGNLQLGLAKNWGMRATH